MGQMVWHVALHNVETVEMVLGIITGSMRLSYSCAMSVILDSHRRNKSVHYTK